MRIISRAGLHTTRRSRLRIALAGLLFAVLAALAAQAEPAAHAATPNVAPEILCLDGRQPLNPGDSLADDVNDVSPAHTDIIEVSSTLTGTELTATFTLRDLPTTLPINRDGTFLSDEYSWTIYIDVDNDPVTGASNILGEPHADGAEYKLTAFRLRSTLPPEVLPIDDVIAQTSVFQYNGTTWQLVTPSNPFTGSTVDAAADTIVLTDEVPNITSSSRLTFAALDMNEAVDFADVVWDSAGCQPPIAIPQAERDALTALFNSTDGNNWTNNEYWLDVDAPCIWYGVTCEQGQVTRLDLSENQLNGTLPAELDNLINLTYLNLGGNELIGTMPTVFGTLTNLEELELGSAGFSGEIPSNLANLTNLRRLDLGDQDLSGDMPAWIGSLSNLERLDLSDNELTGSIPIEYGNLSNLTRLDIEDNPLDPGPIPAWLTSLTNLRDVFLEDLQLTGTIPGDIGNLANLEDLELHENDLTGDIPVSFATLANLTELDLGYNDLNTNVTDQTLLAFLNEKDPDWAATQGQEPPDETPAITVVYMPLVLR
jgi:hypothetical protein